MSNSPPSPILPTQYPRDVVLHVRSLSPLQRATISEVDDPEKLGEGTDRAQSIPSTANPAIVPTEPNPFPDLPVNNAHSYFKLSLDQQKDFWEEHNRQAADYDKILIKRLNEDLNTHFIFVSSSLNLRIASLIYCPSRRVCFRPSTLPSSSNHTKTSSPTQLKSITAYFVPCSAGWKTPLQ